MLGQFVGYCRVKQDLHKTDYFYGPLSDIAGKDLKVLEESRTGDCLCLNPSATGLVDVHHDDIEKFTRVKVMDLFELFKTFLERSGHNEHRST